MKFDSAQAVLWTFLFLLPGFVWSAVYALLIPRKQDSEQIRFMEFFTLSSINNAFWSWLIYLLYSEKLYTNHQLFEAFVVFLIVFLSPATAGIVTAKSKQKGWSARFIESLGFRSALHIATAWDFKLSKTEPTWVNVRLKSGDQIYGLFGPASFAGDANPVADLYLERTLALAEDGKSFDKTLNNGIWMAKTRLLQLNSWRLSMATDKIFKIQDGHQPGPREERGHQPLPPKAPAPPQPTPAQFKSSVIPADRK